MLPLLAIIAFTDEHPLLAISFEPDPFN